MIEGPVSIHDNRIKNPGRGVFWSDEPVDDLSFENNHIVADENEPSQFPEGLFGLRGDQTDFGTVLLAGNIIEVVGGTRDLFRNANSYGAVVRDNDLTNVTFGNAPAGFGPAALNPDTGAAVGPDDGGRFFVGADEEFLVDGFTITEVPEPGALAPLGLTGSALRRRR